MALFTSFKSLFSDSSAKRKRSSADDDEPQEAKRSRTEESTISQPLTGLPATTTVDSDAAPDATTSDLTTSTPAATAGADDTNAVTVPAPRRSPVIKAEPGVRGAVPAALQLHPPRPPTGPASTRVTSSSYNAPVPIKTEPAAPAPVPPLTPVAPALPPLGAAYGPLHPNGMIPGTRLRIRTLSDERRVDIWTTIPCHRNHHGNWRDAGSMPPNICDYRKRGLCVTTHRCSQVLQCRSCGFRVCRRCKYTINPDE